MPIRCPLPTAPAYAIKKAGNDEIKTVEDPKGKVVSTQLASAVDPVAKHLDKRPEASSGEGFADSNSSRPSTIPSLAVANGTSDAALAGLPVLQNLMNQRPGIFELVGKASDIPSYNAWVVRLRRPGPARRASTRPSSRSSRMAPLLKLQQKWLGMTYALPEKDYLPDGAR